MRARFITVFSLVFPCFLTQVKALNLDEGTEQDASDTKTPSLHLFVNGVKSYYIQDVFKGNFFQAEQFCRQHGMNLVTITSKSENDFLQRKIVEKGGGNDRFWTSGTKLPDSNKWIWFTTGRAITYFNWLSGQPDNAEPDEECMNMKIQDEQLHWGDTDCWKDHHFICEAMRNNNCETQNSLDVPIDVRSNDQPGLRFKREI